MLKSMKQNCMLLALVATATMVIVSCSRQTATNIPPLIPPQPDKPGNHSGIQTQFNVVVPMRDGVKLLADVFTPDGPGPFPVLLSRTPYDKESPGTVKSGIAGAEQGFIMVNMDVRGRNHSPGFWEPFKYEINDGYDSVEWAAKLPKSDGKVGMWGAPMSAPRNGLRQLATRPILPASVPRSQRKTITKIGPIRTARCSSGLPNPGHPRRPAMPLGYKRLSTSVRPGTSHPRARPKPAC
jgi:hypothetical protein